MTKINLYIANLGKYNEGELVGAWFELPVDIEEVKEKIGINEQYEEWAIHDYEAPFKIGEYENIDHLNDVAEEMESFSDDEIEALSALVNEGYEDNFIDAISRIDDIIIHHEDNMADIARYYYEENGLLNEDDPLHNYIDWERLGRDMRLEGQFIELENFIIEVLY